MALNKLTAKMTEQEARATQNQNNLHLLASEGTVDEQTIFDELAEKTSESSGAELIGVSPIDGIEGDNAQAVLESVNTQLSQKAPLAALSAAVSAHNTDPGAHSDIRTKIDSDISAHDSNVEAHSDIRDKIGTDISSHNTNGEAHKNIQKNLSDFATEKANAALTAAQEYADIKADDGYSAAKTYTDNAVSAHNTSGEAHGDIRDKISLLQKYPCYEYATSGGAVQRFDEVSVIPHTIGVTVHGATDESGNSVTNPTVIVYGKNMHVFNYKNIRGYTFSGSNCKIVNPTQYVENPYNPSLLLPAGTYTFSCRVTGSREYANKSNFSAFFYIGETQTNIDMNNFVSGTATFKKTFTVTEPTAFRFNNVWFIETPTSADMSLDFQLEVGSTVTEYEPYTEPQTVTVPMTFADGEVVNLTTFNAVSPNMTVIATDDNAVVSVVDVTYNRDVKKALDKLEAAIAALV